MKFLFRKLKTLLASPRDTKEPTRPPSKETKLERRSRTFFLGTASSNATTAAPAPVPRAKPKPLPKVDPVVSPAKTARVGSVGSVGSMGSTGAAAASALASVSAPAVDYSMFRYGMGVTELVEDVSEEDKGPRIAVNAPSGPLDNEINEKDQVNAKSLNYKDTVDKDPSRNDKNHDDIDDDDPPLFLAPNVIFSGFGGWIAKKRLKFHNQLVIVKTFKHPARNSNLSRADYDRISANEHHIMARLKNRNVVSVYNLCRDASSQGSSSEYPYYWSLLIPYYKYGDLFSFLVLCEKNGIPTQSTAKIKDNFFKQMASAVSFLHSRDIVHLDVKLDNFLIDDNYTVKLTDFGMSVDLNGKHTLADKVAALQVQDVSKIGTRSYRPPELFLPQKKLGLLSRFTRSLRRDESDNNENVKKGFKEGPTSTNQSGDTNNRNINSHNTCNKNTNNNNTPEADQGRAADGDSVHDTTNKNGNAACESNNSNENSNKGLSPQDRTLCANFYNTLFVHLKHIDMWALGISYLYLALLLHRPWDHAHRLEDPDFSRYATLATQSEILRLLPLDNDNDLNDKLTTLVSHNECLAFVKQLSFEARCAVLGMLSVDVAHRAPIKEVMATQWISNVSFCTNEEFAELFQLVFGEKSSKKGGSSRKGEGSRKGSVHSKK